jgi:hypothetical protein
MEHLFTTRIKHNDDGIFELDIDLIKQQLPAGYKHVQKDPIIRIDVAYIFIGLWCAPVQPTKKSKEEAQELAR